MPNTFGFGTDTTSFSSTVQEDIQKAVVQTLRAGLIALPKGAVVPASLVAQSGHTFTLRATSYPDLDEAAMTDPLTEGVAPTALTLGIDCMDWTVSQFGAWAKVTDIAQFQSPHNLKGVAKDKIRRLAVSHIDSVARTALATISSSSDTFTALNTYDLLDAKAALASRDVQAIPGVGYYCLLHPNALRGLEGEDGLAGYVNVTAEANSGALTAGAVAQYRGITFLTSTKFEATDGVYPVYFLGAASMAAGDVGTLSYHVSDQAAPGNELAQYASIGVKGIFGAKPYSFSNESDGAGTNDADTVRVYRIGVATGVNGS